MDKFNFQEALSYLQCGFKVSLKLNDTNRVYFMEDNEMYCIPNGKKQCKYKVKSMMMDAITSNDWILCI